MLNMFDCMFYWKLKCISTVAKIRDTICHHKWRMTHLDVFSRTCGNVLTSYFCFSFSSLWRYALVFWLRGALMLLWQCGLHLEIPIMYHPLPLLWQLSLQNPPPSTTLWCTWYLSPTFVNLWAGTQLRFADEFVPVHVKEALCLERRIFIGKHLYAATRMLATPLDSPMAWQTATGLVFIAPRRTLVVNKPHLKELPVCWSVHPTARWLWVRCQRRCKLTFCEGPVGSSHASMRMDARNRWMGTLKMKLLATRDKLVRQAVVRKHFWYWCHVLELQNNWPCSKSRLKKVTDQSYRSNCWRLPFYKTSLSSFTENLFTEFCNSFTVKKKKLKKETKHFLVFSSSVDSCAN